MSARPMPAAGTAHTVGPRGCGERCFTAPVGWGSGDNVPTLRAAAAGWTGEVTSDTSTPLPAPTPLHLTGATFLATDPYATGVAPQAITLATTAGQTRIALGYPAAGLWVQLVLDTNNRMIEEQLSDDSHLIHRRFVYPDPD